jgi:signal transduction histidine kinase
MENITYAEKNRKHKEVAETAFRASKRIEAIIATARKELDHEGAKSLFALENEAHEAAELLSHASKASRVDIQIESDGNTMMWGNHVKFFQVAVNLISNGIDSYKGLSDRAKKKRAVVIKISRTDTHVQFKVEDNGCGMSKEIREMIFEPFFTTKTDGNGIGLGLSTTKSIIEKEFSGSIELKSEPGVGSLFCVTMPIRENEAKHRA